MNQKEAIEIALKLHEKKKFDDALKLYRMVIKEDPKHFQALNLMGLLYQQIGLDEEALTSFEKALSINSSHGLTHYSAGASGLKMGQYALALKHTNSALALSPSDTQALINKGIALHKLGKLKQAVNCYKHAIHINPLLATAYFNLGCTLQEMEFANAQTDAIRCYEISVALNPQDQLVYNNLANSYKAIESFEQAIKVFKQAVALNPELAITYYNKGTTEFFAKHYQQAVLDLTRSVELDPQSFVSWNNLGNAYKEISQFKEALKAYERCICLTKALPSCETYYNIGIVQHELGEYTNAQTSYSKALEIDPTYAQALNARAITLRHLHQFGRSINDFKSVLQINPSFEYALGNLLHTQMHIADWSSWDRYIEPRSKQGSRKKEGPASWLSPNASNRSTTLYQQIFNQQKASHPFPVMALIDDPELHLGASKIWFSDKHLVPAIANSAETLVSNNGSKEFQPKGFVLPKNKIRIAYLSSDFHNHATAYLIAELMELHDRDDFEIFAISFGPLTQDTMQRRIQSGVDRFIDVAHLSDEAIALTCRSLGIDIAVDLKGYTLQSRFNIFIHRCAPVQVAYLGYPGTSGSNCIDYLIADRICVPIGDEQFYSEKIVFMPHSYQANDTQRRIKKCEHSKPDLGLPPSGFVFCCFNNTYKITPPIFGLWMDILSKVEGSVLWLLEDNSVIIENLRLAAKSFSIDPDRLVFAKRVALDDHLGRHIHADLFLDTSPYNAHTTASDALWAGLPVLTLKGKSFAARVASSLLSALGMAELVTNSTKDYTEKAVHLANHIDELKLLRVKIEQNKHISPLFNTPLFTRHLEAAYRSMMQRLLEGKGPEHIQVHRFDALSSQNIR